MITDEWEVNQQEFVILSLIVPLELTSFDQTEISWDLNNNVNCNSLMKGQTHACKHKHVIVNKDNSTLQLYINH